MQRVATGESMRLELWGWEALGGCHISLSIGHTRNYTLLSFSIFLISGVGFGSILDWISHSKSKLRKRKSTKNTREERFQNIPFQMSSYPKVPFWHKLLRHQSKSGSQTAIPAVWLPLFLLPNHRSPLLDPPISFFAQTDDPF